MHFLRILKNEKIYLFLIAVISGTAWFFALFGYLPLAVSNINWILNTGGDPLQTFLGWQVFRAESWGFPLGNFSSLSYPFGTSLTYTDSLPIISIPLKIISPFLGDRFQFIGLWTLGSFILQFWFASLILKEYTKSLLSVVFGASLLVLSPWLIFRAFMHTSLAGQWLILAGFYLILVARRGQRVTVLWPLLVVVSELTMVYLFMMVLAIFSVYCLEKWRFSRRPVSVLLEVVLVGSSAVIAGLISGVFTPSAFKDWGSVGFGFYSMNLNAFINPQNMSAFLPTLPLAHPWQYEGFNYLGLGNLILVFIVIFSIALSKNLKIKNFLAQNSIPVAIGLLLFLYSLSYRITLNDNVLFELPLSNEFIYQMGMFRSSGRFFWPVLYAVVCFALVYTIRYIRLAPVLLAGILIIQFLDLSPLIKSRAVGQPQKYVSPLASEFWAAAPAFFQHIVLLPAWRLYPYHQSFAIYAAQNQMTLNWTYLSRANYNEIYRYGEELVTTILEQGKPDVDTIYNFCEMKTVHSIMSNENSSGIIFYAIDGYMIGLPAENPMVAENKASLPTMRLSLNEVDQFALKNLLHSLNNHQIVFISTRGESPFEGLDADTLGQFKSFGLSMDFENNPNIRYVALFGHPVGNFPLEIESETSAEVALLSQAKIGDFTLPWNVSLKSNASDNAAMILINGADYSKYRNGINLVVLDLENGSISSYTFSRGYEVICP